MREAPRRAPHHADHPTEPGHRAGHESHRPHQGPQQLPIEHHFASYTTSTPLDASSSNNVHHRLNTSGNRALNTVLHTIAVYQIHDSGHRPRAFS
ncbi:transposase [Streptomyces kronopolitis]